MTTFSAGEKLTAAKMNSIVTPAGWTAYTPTWTNLTVGTSAQAFRYFRAGNLIIVKGRITFASGFSVSSAPNFSLPVTATSDTYGGGTVASYRDVSTTTDYNGICRLAGTSAAWLLVLNVAGANDTRTHITSTVPFTWAAGDIIDVFFMYEAA